MTLFEAALYFVIVMGGAVVHEVAHGVVALWCGDTTARDKGRLTLNPLRHIDFILTVLVPVVLLLVGSPILFGGAKPVPINLSRIRYPNLGLFFIAAAGPLSNFLIALIASFIFRWITASEPPSATATLATQILAAIVIVNLSLTVFNLFPVPPLDGGQIVSTLLPRFLATPYKALSRFGIAFVLLMTTGVIGTTIKPLVKSLTSEMLGLTFP
jgi:Zn-dependent protease